MKINDFKLYCIENNIPIITDEALNFIKDLIVSNKVKNILEIGSAYGYSAICFSELGVHVDTIERDLLRASEAKKHIEIFNADVNLIIADALEYEITEKKYDLIFIDAAKGQYLNFFNKYEKSLSDNGIIVCDNILFHNLKIETVKNRNTRQLLKKLDRFKQYLRENENFVTEFLDLGDGLTISKRR